MFFKPAILAFVLFWASTTEGRDAIGSCTADQQYMIDYINQYRSYPVICDQVLSYIAYMHTKDQNDYYNSQPEGTTLYTSSCNKHSWKLTQPCCFPSDFSNSKCMWEAIDRIIPRGKDYGIGNIYEISHGPDDVNRLYSEMTFENAVDGDGYPWIRSGGHSAVMKGEGIWSDKTNFGGCAVIGKYANCIFSA